MSERVSLRFGGYQTEASVHTRALRLLAADVEKRLAPDAAIDIVANVGAHGHKAVDLLAMTARGEFDLCYFASSYIDAAQVPALAALDLPFLITDRARIYAKLDGALGARIAAQMVAATPYRVLGFWDNGFRHMSNGRHPIRSPADCRGLRMRTTTSALHHEIFAAFGFSPIDVDPKDLADAVANGTVDAQENPLTNLVQFGLYRTHRYVSLTTHFFGCTLLLVNCARYDALPQPMQQALIAAARAASEAQRTFAIAEDARCLALLEQDGVAIVRPEAIDRTAFQAAAAGITAREMARIGPEVINELG